MSLVTEERKARAKLTSVNDAWVWFGGSFHCIALMTWGWLLAAGGGTRRGKCLNYAGIRIFFISPAEWIRGWDGVGMDGWM